MMGDKKKMMASILGPPPGESEEGPGPDDGHEIAKELIDAIHAKDPVATWGALSAACDQMDSDPESDEEESE